MYREALAQLRTAKALEIVPGPTHLFDESGALERAALLTRNWFARHLVAPDDVERRRDAQCRRVPGAAVCAGDGMLVRGRIRIRVTRHAAKVMKGRADSVATPADKLPGAPGVTVAGSLDGLTDELIRGDNASTCRLSGGGSGGGTHVSLSHWGPPFRGSC
jgi:hypothetical protein